MNARTVPTFHRCALPLLALAILVFVPESNAAAQDQAPGAPLPGGPIRIVERSDYSRYLNGRYVGHAYRETRASLSPSAGEGGPGAYAGEAFILEESLHDLRAETRQLDRSLPLRLTVSADGSLAFATDAGIPSLRGMPALPAGDLAPGRYWTSTGERVFDLDADGNLVHLPFLAEYRIVGEKSYAGRRALEITSRFATRYSAGSSSPAGAQTVGRIRSATGTHELDILIDAQTHWPLFIRDRFDDTYSLRGAAGDGAGPSGADTGIPGGVAPGSAGESTERRSGFTLIFFEGALPLDRAAAQLAIRQGIASVEEKAGRPAATANAGTGAAGVVGTATGATGTGPATGAAGGTGSGAAAAVAATATGAGSATGAASAGAAPRPLLSGSADTILDDAGVEMAQRSAGIVLRVRDLHFVADSEAILPTDLWRIDAIAAALKALPGRNFLVEGHSAAVGNPAGELALSQRRAKRVADELASRGIEPGRLMFKGYGSSRPIAPNDSDEGRARNRRVEITVLDY